MNGSGKSTLLDAIALALISPIVSSSGYRPQHLIRRSNRGARRLELACLAYAVNWLRLTNADVMTIKSVGPWQGQRHERALD